jgi:electron transfer flavoprotein beta subunit
MRILCLVKLVPDVDKLRYDSERNVLVRDNAHMMINPEDATALALALDVKRDNPDTWIETVSMAPKGAMPHLEDLVRRGVDRATLITDPRYVGSDTWATSRILAQYIRMQACTRDIAYDCIFCGTHTLDGGTAQVPAQTAEILGLPHMANVLQLDAAFLGAGRAIVEVEGEEAVLRFSVELPAFLGFLYLPKHKLPYICYKNISLDVTDRICVLGNDELGLDGSVIGLEGSLTKVRRVQAETYGSKNTAFVQANDEGIEAVLQFLTQKGFLRP